MVGKVKVVRTEVGRVISAKMHTGVVVLVERKAKHAKYPKYVTSFTKLHASDEGNVCVEGDLVKIKSLRPISKMKSWTLLEVLKSKKA